MGKKQGKKSHSANLKVPLSLLSLGEPEPTIPDEEEDMDMEEGTGAATQTGLTLTSIEKMQEELDRTKQELDRSKQELDETKQELDRSKEDISDLNRQLSGHKATFSEEYLANDDIVRFYTGLPNLKVVKTVFDLMRKCVSHTERSKLTTFQEFMATMAKLRLNCPLQDLATRLDM